MAAKKKNKKSVTKKKTVKKAVTKKKTTKKTATKKSASKKKAPVKKSVSKKGSKKKAAKKTTGKKSAPQKAAKKTPAGRQGRASKGGVDSARKKAPEAIALNSKNATADKTTSLIKQSNKRLKKNKYYSAKELRAFQKLLLNLRDHIVDEISFLMGDNLNRSQRDSSGDLSNYSMHMADKGTDNSDREFALNLISSEQDIVYEIEEALRRIDMGTYGICELTGDVIEKERLNVLPHARHSVKAQSELEKGKARFRPYGATLQELP